MVDLTRATTQTAVSNRAPGFADSLDRRFSYAAGFGEKPSELKETTIGETLAYGIPNSIVGGLSEVIESMPGMDKKDAQAFQETVLPSGALANFRAHEAGYKTVGSLATMLIPITTVPRLMQSKKLASAIEKTVGATAARHLTVSGASIADRVKRIKNASHASAKNQFNAITKEANPVLAGKLKAEYFDAAYDTLKIGLATDVATYGLLNESDFLFPESMTAAENAAMYLMPTFAIAGISGVFMRRKLQHVANRIHATAGARHRNAENLPVHELLSTAGDRGAAVSMLAAQKQIKAEEFAQASGNAALQTNINAQKLSLENALVKDIDKMASDSVHPGLTHKHSLSDAEKNTVVASLTDDYASLEGVTSIEELKTGAAELIPTLMKRRQTVVKNELEKLQTEISKTTGAKQRDTLTQQYDELVEQQKELENTFAFVLNPDGSRQLLSDYKTGFSAAKLRQSQSSTLTKNLDTAQEGDVFKVAIDETDDVAFAVKFTSQAEKQHAFISPDLKVGLRKEVFDEPALLTKGIKKSAITNKTYQALNFEGRTAIQHTGRLAVDAWNPATAKPIELSASMHHTEIDMLFALKQKWGQKNPHALDKIKFNDTVRNWDDLEYLTAASKYREYVADVDIMLQAEKRFLKLKPAQKTTHGDVVKTLNLPNDGVYGADPMTQVFQSLYTQGAKEFGEQIPSFARMKEELRLSKNPRVEILGESSPQVIQSMGVQYQPIKETRKPVLLLGKNAYENPYSVDDYWHIATEQRATQMKRFDAAAQRGDAPLLELIRQEVLVDPERLVTAKQVFTLVEGGQARRGAFEAGVQAMDAVNNQPVIQAIDSIQDQTGKITQRFISEEVFAAHTPTLQKLISHNNVGDLTSFAIARHQLGQGWRGVNFEVSDDGIRLILEDHEFNKQLFQKLYPNTELPEKLYLPQPKAKVDSPYVPMQISELASQSMASYNEMSQAALRHINELRGISGLKPIPRRQFHLPPKNLQDKEQIVLLNHSTGEIDSVITGNTAQQVRKNAEQEIAAAKEQGLDLFSATDADLANYHHMELQLLQGADDYSTTFRQTGTAKGRSFGQVIETGPEVVEAMNQGLVRQYSQISRVTSAVMFEPELRTAELAMRSAGLTKKELDRGLTIWAQWKNRALGLKAQNKNQFVGRVYGAVEDAYDTTLNKLWDAKVATLTGKPAVGQAEKTYNALGKATPGYNPIQDAETFLCTTTGVKAPHSMMKHMAQLNNLAGLTMLRMFETGLALVNLGTLPSLIPVVANALQRQKGQTLAEWKKANAAWSSTIDEQTAIWNPYRTFTTGMHYMFTDPGRAALKKAAAKGNLKQEVVERMEDITAPSIGYTERMVRNGAKQVSFIVDKSEQLSRSISYLTFHNMGVKNLKLGDDAAHEFAHQMANRTIGDFRPNNKPRIFQGATGAPFGLFTTFAYNYLQRVFGYLEKGQYNAFFQQMGLQASLFGAKSLPGFNQYVDHFTSNYDGTENMVDRLDRSVGSEMTDALLFGTVGTLTGLASYTRTDIRLPGSNLATASSVFDLAPAAGMITKTYAGITETIKAATSESGLSSGRLSEIASRTFPVKAVRGWIDLAQGYQTDARGQIVDENIQGAAEVFSRLSSIRTLRDQRLMEEFSRQKNQQMKQQAVRNDARQAVRSLFREGKLNGENLNGVARDYLRSGGEPGDFDNFLVEQAKYGLINKGFLKALSIANSPGKQDDFIRLMRILSDRDRLTLD